LLVTLQVTVLFVEVNPGDRLLLVAQLGHHVILGGAAALQRGRGAAHGTDQRGIGIVEALVAADALAFLQIQQRLAVDVIAVAAGGRCRHSDFRLVLKRQIHIDDGIRRRLDNKAVVIARTVGSADAHLQAVKVHSAVVRHHGK